MEEYRIYIEYRIYSTNHNIFGLFLKLLENLTGNNSQQFNNSALANLTTGISERYLILQETLWVIKAGIRVK